MIVVKYCIICGATYRDLRKKFCDVKTKREIKYLVSQDEYETTTTDYFPVLVTAALTIEERDT